MDHHRARPVAEFLHRRCRSRVAGALRQQLARQRAGRDAGDHRLRRADVSRRDASRTPVARAAGRGDLGHFGVGEDLAAGRDEHPLQRPDHGVGAALADHHAKALVGHAFEIGEERAAGDVGREIEMHAPGGQRRLHMRRTRNSRRATRAARKAAAAPCRARRRRPSCARPSMRCRRARAPSSASRAAGKDARRRPEMPRPAAPGLGIGMRKCRDARDRLLEVAADAEPASVGQGAGETIGDRRERQPVRFQSICIFPMKGRAGEEAEIHRAEIVAEAGKRDFAGPDRAADRRLRSKTADLPAFAAPDARRMPDCCGPRRR